MSTSSRSLILRAIEILKTRGWTRNSMAKDKWGYSIGVLDSGATCFCAVGALRRAGHEAGILPDSPFYTRARDAIDRVSPRQSIIHFNDDCATDKEDVIKKFLEAADRA